ncbi:MAG TPA: ubiquinone/menaquinone biosynthesis methyltransferase [Acidimicrobiia bacterium]|jgi:demethylmenaquinone methyltransferase/2-methoxy-6-polyprenyl-1,4-benzoquinol methylase
MKPGSVLPTGDEKVAAVDAMFDAIAPRYDLCNRVISLGLDVGWRRRTVRALGLAAGATVLDLACGTGDLCRELRRVGLVPVGVDRSAGMLAAAAGARGVPDDGGAPAPLVRGDALSLPLRPGAVDGLVCGFALRNFASLPPMFAECARVVRPGGVVAFLEVDTPPSAVLRAGHRVWFGGVVPLIGALLSDGAAYRYLPRSVAYLPPPDELARLLAQAGFTRVGRTRLSGGIAQLVTAVRS